MAEAKDRYGSIYQNLIDAGCGQRMTELCMAFVKEGQFSDIVPVLTRHRKALLGSVHKGQENLKMNTTIPKIALGAWSWGAGAAGGDQVFGNHLFEEELKPVFEKAMECGLNLWDTAAVYGEGASERILGNFVKDVRRDSVILSTKFTPQIAGSSPDAMQEMLDCRVQRDGGAAGGF